jgi:chitinase
MKAYIFLLIFFICLSSNAQNKPYKVIAYYTGNGETIRQYPVHKLTHIIYSFLKLQNDTLTFHNDQQKTTLQQLVALKKEYPGLKIMVSVGGWSGCAPCSDLFASELHRETFAKTTVALLRQYGIDGLDIDWEYPAIEGYPGHKYDSSDRNNFTLLLRALRKEMSNDFLLSFAAGGFVKYLQYSIDWTAVAPLVDFINLMTYDLVGGYSTVTGHHTPLKSYMTDQQSVDRCVDWLLHGDLVPRNKLIIGAAFYARVWEFVSPVNNGLYQSGKFKQGVAYKNFTTYFTDSLGYKYYIDKKAKAPFCYSESKELFATFDDEYSIREKCNYIRSKRLGGIMFWELSQDKPSKGLLDVIVPDQGRIKKGLIRSPYHNN